MKRLILLLTIVSMATELFAQDPVKQALKAVPVRQVSGIVIDSTEQAVIASVVILTSLTDTLRTSTNEDGMFFFKNVKAWEFTITVRSLGYRTFVKIGKYNDSKVVLTMDPIVLNGAPRVLNEVIVDGTPSIRYKIDTVEYKASDYKVREGSDVGELLKKMEGMELSKDGALTYNGAAVKEARLNGKNFMSGDVQTVTKNLPADIVEKVQIIEDHGDLAARTGIKDKDPVKVLNITTKADRSLGYFAKVGGGAGNNSRYEGDLNGTKINANRNYTLSGTISNTVNGVASASESAISSLRNSTPESLVPGGSGGNTRRQGAGFTYRDQWSRKTQVNMNYSYNWTRINSINSSVAQDFSTNGTTFSNIENTGDGNSNRHLFSFELENKLDSVNYLKITPTLSYTSSRNEGRSATRLSGIVRQNQESLNLSSNQTPNYGIKVLYDHKFSRKGRILATEIDLANKDIEQNRDQNTVITYFDLLTNTALKDSLINRLVNRSNLNTNYRGLITYSEPLNLVSQVQFSGQLSHNAYTNNTQTSELNQSGQPSLVDSLSNAFKYSFTQARIGINYSYDKSKFGLRAGTMVIPTSLNGLNNSTGKSFNRTNFYLVPVFRLQYQWSLQQQFSMYYSGTITEAIAEQIQPVRDVSNPQNTFTGNPELKPVLSHSISTSYSNYFPNSKFGVSANLGTTLFEDKIISNIIQVQDAYNSLKYERYYLNINGSSSTSANISINKQSVSRKSSFSLTGNINYQHNPGMSNNIRNTSDQWTFREKLGMRINPSEKIEINPSFSYIYSRSDNTLPSAIYSKATIC